MRREKITTLTITTQNIIHTISTRTGRPSGNLWDTRFNIIQFETYTNSYLEYDLRHIVCKLRQQDGARVIIIAIFIGVTGPLVEMGIY